MREGWRKLWFAMCVVGVGSGTVVAVAREVIVILRNETQQHIQGLFSVVCAIMTPIMVVELLLLCVSLWRIYIVNRREYCPRTTRRTLVHLSSHGA